MQIFEILEMIQGPWGSYGDSIQWSDNFIEKITFYFHNIDKKKEYFLIFIMWENIKFEHFESKQKWLIIHNLLTKQPLYQEFHQTRQCVNKRASYQ